MKKGFTLVELLAVIVILGVIAVIIIPKVTSSLKDSEEKTSMESAKGLLKAAEYKIASNEITGAPQSKKINYTNGTNKDYLDYSGAQPEKGQLQIRYNGAIAMAVKIGNNCYIKKFDSEEIKIISYNEQTCGENADVFMNYDIPPITQNGDGLYESTTEPGRLIYRGADPNNRIFLKEDGINNTLYRIVSFEPDGTIKVVRDERIPKADGTEGGIEWDTSNARKSDGTNNTYCTSSGGCNVWGNQTNTLYNGESLGDNFRYSYYASADATTLTNGNSGKVGSDSTLNQYLNSKTTNATNSWQPAIILDSYIDNHQWNVGGIYYTVDDKGIVKEKEEERQLKWTGKIALLNITEYAEVSLNPDCTSVRGNYYGSSSGSPCKELNWTYKEYSQWSLSPSSTTRTSVWYVNSAGSFNYYSATNTFGVRPAFYLKSSIKLSGSGTLNDEYTID